MLWICTLCTTAMSESLRETHLNSPAHQRRQGNPALRDPIYVLPPPPAPNPPSPSPLAVAQLPQSNTTHSTLQESFLCGTCNAPIPTADVRAHLTTSPTWACPHCYSLLHAVLKTQHLVGCGGAADAGGSGECYGFAEEGSTRSTSIQEEGDEGKPTSAEDMRGWTHGVLGTVEAGKGERQVGGVVGDRETQLAEDAEAEGQSGSNQGETTDRAEEKQREKVSPDQEQQTTSKQPRRSRKERLDAWRRRERELLDREPEEVRNSKTWYCDVCKCTMGTVTKFTHVAGRKHKKVEKLLSESGSHLVNTHDAGVWEEVHGDTIGVEGEGGLSDAEKGLEEGYTVDMVGGGVAIQHDQPESSHKATQEEKGSRAEALTLEELRRHDSQTIQGKFQGKEGHWEGEHDKHTNRESPAALEEPFVSSGSWECNICAKSMSATDRTSHFEGRKHRTNQTRLEQKQKLDGSMKSSETKLQQLLGEPQRWEEQQSQLYEHIWCCTICLETMPFGSKDAHSSRGCKRATDFRHPTPAQTSTISPPESGIWECTLCDRTMSVCSRQSHLVGRTHRRNARQPPTAILTGEADVAQHGHVNPKS